MDSVRGSVWSGYLFQSPQACTYKAESLPYVFGVFSTHFERVIRSSQPLTSCLFFFWEANISRWKKAGECSNSFSKILSAFTQTLKLFQTWIHFVVLLIVLYLNNFGASLTTMVKKLVKSSPELLSPTFFTISFFCVQQGLQQLDGE